MADCSGLSGDASSKPPPGRRETAVAKGRHGVSEGCFRMEEIEKVLGLRGSSGTQLCITCVISGLLPDPRAGTERTHSTFKGLTFGRVVHYLMLYPTDLLPILLR